MPTERLQQDGPFAGLPRAIRNALVRSNFQDRADAERLLSEGIWARGMGRKRTRILATWLWGVERAAAYIRFWFDRKGEPEP